MAAIQQQQQLQRQLMAQQMLMQQQAAAAAAAATASAVAAAASGSTAVQTADRKAREIYVGNLAIGVVTPDMLKELFNAILGSHVPDPVNQPPVCNVTMDPNGVLGRGCAPAHPCRPLALRALGHMLVV